MPFIEIHMLEGRSNQIKSKLAKAVTKAVCDVIKVEPSSVIIEMQETTKDKVFFGGKKHT